MKFLGNVLVFLFVFSLGAMAQGSTTLKGTLLDKADNEPIISGSIELLNAKDSVVIMRALTKLDGSFSFPNLSKGNYVVKATFIGYNPTTKPVTLTENQKESDLGNLLLEVNGILLKEMVVEGKTPDVIVKNDTIEYDAASYKTTENAVIEDLLKKLPGVEVDKDGKITANGKEIKKFMVDGKEFFTDDPQIASKNLPAEMVEKLQVIDRKSEMARMTGFDDGEEETIINITVREGMKQGTTGNFAAGGGKDVADPNDWRYAAGTFLNYMRNNDRYTLIASTNNNNNMNAADLGANQFGGMRMNRGGGGGITESSNVMFNINKELSKTASLNGDIRYNTSSNTSDTKSESATITGIIDQLDRNHSTNKYNSDNLSANLRFEWKPDTMNTLLVRPNFRYNKSNSSRNELYSDRYDYNTMNPIYESNSSSKTKGNGVSFGGTLDYSHRFDKMGRVLSLNVQGNYNDNESQENSLWYKRTYLDGGGTKDENQDRRSENDNISKSFRGTLSFVEPLGNNFFMQAFYRMSYSNSESVNSTYDMIYIPDSTDPSGIGEAYLNPEQSRSTKRDVIDQRFAMNVKMVREKYDLTLGLNVDPSRSTNKTYEPSDDQIEVQYLPYPYDDRLANILGDELISEIKQNIVNFSPIINFNYRFGQRSNLRIDYEGSTNQPSANQLRDYMDTSNPNNYTQGNPNLKPGYSNRIRTRFQKYVAETQLMYNVNLDFNFSNNDIVSVTRFLEEGVRLTSYENINGNWNTQLGAMFNMPLRNKKFSIGTFARASYRNTNSYVSAVSVNDDPEKNTMKNFSLMARPNANYRSDLFDLGLNLSVNYSDISYSAQPEKSQNTTNYGVGANTTWYLPYKFTIESDISHTRRSGYATGYNVSETMWNAAITKQLFTVKGGVGSLKLQIYDILKDRNSITSSYTTNGYQTSQSYVIPSYFMGTFIFKFNAFGGSSRSRGEGEPGGERRREMFIGGPSPRGGGSGFGG